MFDETKVITATEIVNNPDNVYRLVEPIIIVSDQSIRGTFSNLVTALNLLYPAGYRIVAQVYNDSGIVFTTLEQSNYKNKNTPSLDGE